MHNAFFCNQNYIPSISSQVGNFAVKRNEYFNDSHTHSQMALKGALPAVGALS